MLDLIYLKELQVGDIRYSEVAVFDKGFYKVTIDGNVKKVKNGETITLPDVNSEGTNKLGYYDVEK